MKCDICKEKEATIHIQEIISNNIKTIHICENCAKMYGFKSDIMDMGFNLFNLFSQMNNNETGKNEKNDKNKPLPEEHVEQQNIILEENKLKCPQCSTTYDELLETGKFGCGYCYLAFKEQIKPIIRRIHGTIYHKGKVPEKYKKQIKIANDLRGLNNRLKSAVKKENYEQAAELRDKIKLLAKKLEK